MSWSLRKWRRVMKRTLYEDEGVVDEDEDEDFVELIKLCYVRSSRIP
jgi:hypothetical protein